jgi:hypothetical protein
VSATARRPSPRAAPAQPSAPHCQSGAAGGELRELPREEMGAAARRRFAELDDLVRNQGYRTAKFVLPDGREAILAVPLDGGWGADEIARRCEEELERLAQIARRRGAH